MNLAELAEHVRRRYAAAHRAGLTYDEMAEAVGMPSSSFSLLVRGYRPINKLDTLQKLLDGVERVEAMQ